MPKDLNKCINWPDACGIYYKEPARDTIRDSIGVSDTVAPGQVTDTPDIRPDSIPRDTLREDQLSRPAELPPDRKADSAEAFQRPLEEKAASTTTADAGTSAPASAGEKKATDSISSLYDILGVTELPIGQRLENDPAHYNFLYSIPCSRPADTVRTEEIYIPAGTSAPSGHPDKEGAPGQPSQTRQAIQQVPADGIHPVEKPEKPVPDWITLVLAGALILIGWTRLFYRKYFENLIRSFHFYNYAASLYHGKNSLTQRAALLLNLNFFVSGGLVALQAFQTNGLTPDNLTGPQLWLALSGFLIAWYVWNFLMIHIIGFVFLRQNVFQEYFHNYNLYRKMIGLALFPVAVVVHFIHQQYQGPILMIGGIAAGLIFLTHIIRGLQIFAKERVSLFYFFLYLCALEFFPIVLVFELFIRQLTS